MVFLANVSARQTDEVIGFVAFTIFFGFIAYHIAKEILHKPKNPDEPASTSQILGFRAFSRRFFILIYFVMMVFASIVLIIKYVKQL